MNAELCDCSYVEFICTCTFSGGNINNIMTKEIINTDHYNVVLLGHNLEYS